MSHWVHSMLHINVQVLYIMILPYTVEPLIKDPPRKGQPLHKDTILGPYYSNILSFKKGKVYIAGPTVSFVRRFHCIVYVFRGCRERRLSSIITSSHCIGFILFYYQFY